MRRNSGGNAEFEENEDHERSGAQFVVDTEGKKTAVLLSVRQYEKLLEDLHDLAVIAARRDEAPMTFEEQDKQPGDLR